MHKHKKAQIHPLLNQNKMKKTRIGEGKDEIKARKTQKSTIIFEIQANISKSNVRVLNYKIDSKFDITGKIIWN